jgi:hypothetical protein
MDPRRYVGGGKKEWMTEKQGANHMEKARKMLIMDAAVSALLAGLIAYVIISIIWSGDRDLVSMLVVGINTAVLFSIIVSFVQKVRGKGAVVQESYDRYCTQMVNGQMTEFPTISKQECFKSIPEGVGWANGMKAVLGDNHSYRIVDMADGGIINIDGVSVERKQNDAFVVEMQRVPRRVR